MSWLHDAIIVSTRHDNYEVSLFPVSDDSNDGTGDLSLRVVLVTSERLDEHSGACLSGLGELPLHSLHLVDVSHDCHVSHSGQSHHLLLQEWEVQGGILLHLPVASLH